MSELSKAIQSAEVALDIEIKALQTLRAGIANQLEPALTILANCKGKVVVTGLGKSGLVGAKIAATFASTGTSSFFLHSTDALHGDSGALTADDVLIAISNSGKTAEVCQVAAMAKSWGNRVITITAKSDSPLAKLGDALLNIEFEKEADPLNLAPTTSTTLTLALGDALAAALMVHRNFTASDFGKRHPGGTLGSATNK